MNRTAKKRTRWIAGISLCLIVAIPVFFLVSGACHKSVVPSRVQVLNGANLLGKMLEGMYEHTPVPYFSTKDRHWKRVFQDAETSFMDLEEDLEYIDTLMSLGKTNDFYFEWNPAILGISLADLPPDMPALFARNHPHRGETTPFYWHSNGMRLRPIGAYGASR